MNLPHRAAALVRLAAIAICWSFLLPADTAAAEEPQSHESQAWLISTRSLGGSCAASTAAQPAFWELTADNRWQRAEPEAFSAADKPGVPTVIFIHGNRVWRQEAVNRGWLVYHLIKSRSGGKPFRFVIWSWPSDEIRGPLKDVRAKAARSDVEAYYLASVIRRIHSDVPLTLIGYSFGARSVTGAMELLAGGNVAGRRLSQLDEAPERRVRAMLLAAAMDSHWLLPGQYHGQALDRMEQAFITVNPADRVLKHYHLMYRCSNPQALGWAGPAGRGCLGAEQAKLEMANVACNVGKEHDFFRYIHSPAVTSRLALYGFLEEPQPESPAADEQPAGPALTGGDTVEKSVARAD
ncbi:MAG: alpha/beta hydrolase [Pirellulales bacterium]|nr:alpha/beta hydrolase [Pirellulales bacterium]